MPEHFQFYFYAAVLALLSWWLVKLTDSEPTSDRASHVAHSAEYFSHDYVKWEMDESGQLKSKLVAKAMRHYGDDGTTHLQQPVLTLMNPETPPWVISSETGIVSADGQQILLNGKAMADRAGAPGFKPLRINSSNFTVQPARELAVTDDWAELLSPPDRTEGVGMQLNYGSPIQIQLFSKVRGRYGLKK